MARPTRNPDYSDKKRQTHVVKQILEETAQMEKVGVEKGAKTDWELLRDYFAEKRMVDHVTYLVAVQAFSGLRIGIPKMPKEQLDFEHARDNFSGIMGMMQQRTKSVAIARQLHRDPETGDIEYVFFNANKEPQLEEFVNRQEQIMATMRKRIEIKVTNVRKPINIRQRILKQEQLNNRGVF